MKNHNKMYQSLLSRYEEHQEKKKKRILILKRTVPVLACFCLTIALGVGYWGNLKNLPKIPVQTNIIEESTIETSDIITTVSYNNPMIQTDTHIGSTTTMTGKQTQKVTTLITDASKTQISEQVTEKQTKTQTTVTLPPITYTQPVTESPVISTVETPVSLVTEPITTTEWIRPITPLAQPVRFSDIRSAIDAINTSDVSSYSEQEQEVYRDMFDRIKNDGFIYQINNTNSVSLIDDRGITLFPYASYEDVGVGFYVRFKEKIYHITFYYADCNLITHTDSIAEYLQSRMGRRSDKIINVSDTNVSLLFANDGQIYAGALIDKDHYYSVNTITSEEEIIEFLNAFSFEQTLLLS